MPARACVHQDLRPAYLIHRDTARSNRYRLWAPRYTCRAAASCRKSGLNGRVPGVARGVREPHEPCWPDGKAATPFRSELISCRLNGAGLPMQQIAEWLKELGLSEYTDRFTENEIDSSVLPHPTDQDLKERLAPCLVTDGKCSRRLASAATSPSAAKPTMFASALIDLRSEFCGSNTRPTK